MRATAIRPTIATRSAQRRSSVWPCWTVRIQSGTWSRPVRSSAPWRRCSAAMRSPAPPSRKASVESSQYFPGRGTAGRRTLFAKHDCDLRAMCDRSLPYFEKYWRERRSPMFIPWQTQAWGEHGVRRSRQFLEVGERAVAHHRTSRSQSVIASTASSASPGSNPGLTLRTRQQKGVQEASSLRASTPWPCGTERTGLLQVPLWIRTVQHGQRSASATTGLRSSGVLQ